MAETTELLRPGKFSFGFAAGGGGLAGEGSGAGGAMRVRVGLGARQELGLEGGAVYYSNRSFKHGDPPWISGGGAIGAKLTWKGVPLPWLAVLGGPALSSASNGGAAGGDLAVLFSSARPLSGWVRPYAAVRGFFMLPIGRDLDEAGGPTAGLVLPVGLAVEANQRVRFFFEAGGIGAWSNIGTAPGRSQAATAVTASGECGAAPGGTVQWICGPGQHGGGYAMVGVTVKIERIRDQASFIETLRRWQ